MKDFQFLNGMKATWVNKLPSVKETVNVENFSLFFDYIFERQEIWFKRFILGLERPWTDNPYLRDYKFTNVYRELDRASQFLIKNILSNEKLSLENLLFKLFVYRFFNQPDTFESGKIYLPDYDNYKPTKLWKEVVNYRKAGENPFHTAYMQNMAFFPLSIKDKIWPTLKKNDMMLKDYAYCMYVFPQIHKIIPDLAKVITKKKFNNPEQLIKELEKLPATAGFQSHEFYLDFCYLNKYSKYEFQFNENDYTNVGPGCSLGIRLIFPSLSPDEQKQAIYWLRDLSKKELKKRGDFKFTNWDKEKDKYVVSKINNITLHQIEFCLCEFSKLWKMIIKEGKQRSRFEPKTKGL